MQISERIPAKMSVSRDRKSSATGVLLSSLRSK